MSGRVLRLSRMHALKLALKKNIKAAGKKGGPANFPGKWLKYVHTAGVLRPQYDHSSEQRWVQRRLGTEKVILLVGNECDWAVGGVQGGAP